MASIKIHIKSLRTRFSKWLRGFFSDEYLSDVAVRVLFGAGAAALILVWVFSVFSFGPTEYLVPLKYNSFLGVTELGSWYQLYYVPLALLGITIVNGLLANITYSRDKMISYTLLGITIFVNICGAAVVVPLSILVNR